MHVIGTAGHVDHGKSTLVKALTGINPDRLKEEQDREMTIDLGFAWLTLPDGEEVGIVDVPGHRDFIENMLAGVGGIEAVLLVIAADEGIMPQTREHLAIIDLLNIRSGIVVLNKVDLIDDPNWLELVEADVRHLLSTTVLQAAPILRVSARTKAGFDELLQNLGMLLKNQLPRPDLGRPRLPVDRAFTMAGFGTVVTGTLQDGCFTAGDEVEILPAGLRGRIRGLQTHKKNESTSTPGTRTAVNLSGVKVKEVARGDVLVFPDQYRTTQRIDVHFKLLEDASGPLKHSSQVKLFLGTSETIADVRLLGKEILAPGQECWLQLDLRLPVVATRGDRYILRRPSPAETLGGGIVVDSNPVSRHKRFDKKVLAQLESFSLDSPVEVFIQTLMLLGPSPIDVIIQHARLRAEDLASVLEDLVLSKRLVQLESGTLTPSADILVSVPSVWLTFQDRALKTVETFHQNYPLRIGIPLEELKSRLKFAPRVANALLEQMIRAGILARHGHQVALPNHTIRFSTQQQTRIDLVMTMFAASPYTPPPIKECQEKMGAEVYNALVELGEFTPVSTEIVFRKKDYDLMVDEIKRLIQRKGKVTLAEVRTLFNTSRRFAQALLENLDAVGVTLRQGDVRVLKT